MWGRIFQLIAGAIVLSTTVLFADPGSASRFKTLHSFCKYDCYDGGSSQGNLTVDKQGNIYGTNFWFGPYGGPTGAVFELQNSAYGYVYRLLYAFCQTSTCPDGALPTRLILSKDGSLFGLATYGGNRDWGTIFQLSPNADRSQWTFKKLYDFGDSYGICGCYEPTDLTYAGEGGGALYDGSSPLFGTSSAGGGNSNGVYDPGTVFEVIRNVDGTWSGKTLHAFCSLANCTDGLTPVSILAVSPTKLFGVTAAGGDNTAGALFEMYNSSGHWHEKAIYSFCSTNCTQIANAAGRLLLGSDGALYGNSSVGGEYNGGAIFKITPKLSGAKAQLLYSFCALANCSDGQNPYRGLVFDSSGALVGATENGGGQSVGTIFRLEGSSLQTLHSFCRKWPDCDGRYPENGVTIDSSGTMFGTTLYGGRYDNGIVFRLIPDP